MLRDRTLWISVACFAAVLFMVYRVLVHHDSQNLYLSALFLAVFGFVFLGAADVVFDRKAETCALRLISSFRIIRARLRFRDILDVKVEIAPANGRSNTTMCRLTLVTASGPIPLTRSYEPSLERYNAMRDAVVLALAADLPLSAESRSRAGAGESGPHDRRRHAAGEPRQAEPDRSAQSGRPAQGCRPRRSMRERC